MNPKLLAYRQLVKSQTQDLNQAVICSLAGYLAALGYLNAPYALSLGLSIGSTVAAYYARSVVKQLDISRSKLRKLEAQASELEATEEALDYATARVALEESYGLIINEPRSANAPAPARQSQPVPYDENGFEIPDVDTGSWLTDAWVRSSKVICAASGAGKSTYLRYEYRRAVSLGKTYLIDPHLRANHLESSYWTSSKEQDLRLVAHTPSQIAAVLEVLIAEVQDRLNGKSELVPVHVIIDEADGHLFKDDGIAKSFKDLVVLIANEARKTRVTLSFVVHSIQKQKSGLDASDLVQISWMIMGNSLATPYSRWPSDLDPKEWGQKQTDLQSELDGDRARALVVYRKGQTSLAVLDREDLQIG
jgi:hypothetical protein